MSVPVRGRVPTRGDGKFTDEAATHIAERLRALEKAISGGQVTFTPFGTPTFGSGSGSSSGGSSGGGSGGGSGTPGVTDHGALTGLDDNDHPQYLLHEDQARPKPHVHGEWEVVGLDNRFVVRGESVRAAAHQHRLSDVADFNLWELMLWKRVLEG